MDTLYKIMLGETRLGLQIVKSYLKTMNRQDRQLRLVFVGRRLIIKQYNWLHFNRHPWEDSKGE